MCRFLAYRGREIFMSDLLMHSSRSLILQSFKAREREEPLNGDGFGVGWYAHELDPEPGLFTSVRPAWGNRNLIRLAPKIRSSCFFAHVRAASTGSPVTELNCHPFQFGRFLWMHNGWISGFSRIKRRMREGLADEIYDGIQGTTDSEHAFALFLHHLYKHMQDYSMTTLTKAMRNTVASIERWSIRAGARRPSHMNFAVSDGHNVIATRYVTDGDEEPQSLYVAQGERLEVRDGRYRMLPAANTAESVIIASEPLTDSLEDWQAVPPNHVVMVSPELHLRITAL
jgi:ergothioneine biosynthesis protein EgtC